MIDNMLFILDSEFHLLDIWINNSTKRTFKLLKLFQKLLLVLKILALKRQTSAGWMLSIETAEMITSRWPTAMTAI